MSGFSRQTIRFIAVGCAAAATHWCVAVLSVAWLGLAPLNANIVGWCIAFWVSFSGHFHVTFRHHGQRWWPSAARFLFVSAAGFAINEAAYAWLLRKTALPYGLALAVVLIAVAVLTYLASRAWAFRRTPSA